MAEKPLEHPARELCGNGLGLLVIGDVIAQADLMSLLIPIEVVA